MSENETWRCDCCGGTIDGPSDGWVQWLTIKNEDDEGGYRCEGLQLVHRSRRDKRSCIYNGTAVYREKNATTADGSLEDFVGDEGLMRLLSFINDRDFANSREVVEMIKRIFIPDFERVRLHLNDATAAGVYEPNTPDGFPHMSDIKAVCEWLDERAQDR